MLFYGLPIGLKCVMQAVVGNVLIMDSSFLWFFPVYFSIPTTGIYKGEGNLYV